MNSSINLDYNIPNEGDVLVNITDIQGKILFSKDFGKQPAGTNTMNLNVEKYKPGMYFINLKINDAVCHDKLIKG